MQVPEAHTSPAPHPVPSGLFPVVVQVPGCVVDVHSTAPVAHGFAGSQAAPAVQVGATHAPPLHTFPPPHAVPSGLLLVTMQLASEIADGHEVIPVVHGFAGWHTWFGEQVAPTQAPSLHAAPLPHEVPFGKLALSVQAGAADPDAHVVVPVLHAFAGWQG